LIVGDRRFRAEHVRRRASKLLLASVLLALAHCPSVLGQGPPPPVYTAMPPVHSLPGPQPREPLRVGLPVPQVGPNGEMFVQPNVGGAVSLAAMEQAEALPPPAGGLAWPGAEAGGQPATGGGLLPNGLLSGDPSDLFWPGSEPLIPWDEFQSIRNRPISPTGEPGLGRERVMFAPFEIDITQTFGNFLLRADAAYNLTKPDRAEYFWARPGRGPARPESGVDYQDFHFRMENGNNVFSLATDIPIRLLNPDVNGNNGGIGDIQLVQKTVLMNGSRWQMTQILRTVFNSGNARKGLGTGHISMEPGLLCRYKWSDLTYFHGQAELRFPIAGDPIYSGPALTWGVGVSHVWYETDTVAFIPTLEFINIWILDRQVTPFPGGLPVDVKGDGIFNLAPGLRTAWDTGGDLGVVELGFSSIFSVGSNGWYDALLRFDMRFVF
jgi:hypothetical protein